MSLDDGRRVRDDVTVVRAQPGPAPSHAGPMYVDVVAARHPAEASRFALAVLAVAASGSLVIFAAVALGQTTRLMLIVLGVPIAWLSVWLVFQLLRLRLLGDAVRVTPEALPDLDQVLQETLRRLRYERRLDVFVVEKASRVLGADGSSVSLASFFGVDVIIIEGDVLGDLTVDRERRDLAFLLAAPIGALCSRHTRWTPALMAIQVVRLPLAATFIKPWRRATVLTGDRIALACCEDLGVGLEVVHRMLVGRIAAPHVQRAGLVAQALRVRRHPALRLAQLLRAEPHATTRYLELLAFARQQDPARWARDRGTLGPPPEVDRVLDRLEARRPWPGVVSLAALLAVAMLSTAAAAGVTARSSDTVRALVAAFDTEQAPSVPTSLKLLLAEVPTSVQVHCAGSAGLPSAIASLDCTDTAIDSPQSVLIDAMPSGAMDDSVLAWQGYSLPSADTGGTCADGWFRGLGTLGGASVELLCGTDSDGNALIVVIDTTTDVVVRLSDVVMSTDELLSWWSAQA